MPSFVFKGKMVVVGDIAVGKTSLVTRFTSDQFTRNHIASVGVSYFPKTFVVDDSFTVNFDIWDTAGQERYRSINKLYYRGAAAAIIVFDLTQRSTFDSVKTAWLDNIRECADPNIIVVLAGSKSDMMDNRVVPQEAIDTLCREENLHYIETSALTGEGVSKVFSTIANTVKQRNETDKPHGFQLLEFRQDNDDKVDLRRDFKEKRWKAKVIKC